MHGLRPRTLNARHPSSDTQLISILEPECIKSSKRWIVLHHWNDRPKGRKLSHLNHYTGTRKPAFAPPQASKLQLPLLAFDPGSTGPDPEALPTVLTREVFLLRHVSSRQLYRMSYLCLIWNHRCIKWKHCHSTVKLNWAVPRETTTHGYIVVIVIVLCGDFSPHIDPSALRVNVDWTFNREDKHTND